MKPLISFCTWIHNRLWQYCQVLKINLEITSGQPVEFVLLDIDSTDGLHDWLLSTGLIHKIKYHRQPHPLHTSRLKNLSHGLASGDILVNLDADNILGPQFCEKALSLHSKQFLHAWSGDWSDGTCGRLAYHRELFDTFGGYDESLGPVGFDDLDLRNRFIAGGCECVLSTDADVFGDSIPNTRHQAVEHMQVESWDSCNSRNAANSQRNIQNSKLIANQI